MDVLAPCEALSAEVDLGVLEELSRKHQKRSFHVRVRSCQVELAGDGCARCLGPRPSDIIRGVSQRQVSRHVRGRRDQRFINVSVVSQTPSLLTSGVSSPSPPMMDTRASRAGSLPSVTLIRSVNGCSFNRTRVGSSPSDA